MIPIALRLDNFMSYRSPTTVDFSGVRTACLSGDNGAGKSALLEAMTWAVWGKTRASSDRDVITIGESQMEVTFDFRLSDRDHRVFRRRTAGARASATLEFFVRDIGAADWLSISADSVRETERKIVSTLKMDYETFVNSAFLMQGQADTFTEKRPGERKKVLADILNLGDYDVLNALARDEERTLRARGGHIRDLVSRLDQQLEQRPQVEAELEKLSSSLLDIGSKTDVFEKDVHALQDQLNALAGLIRSRDAATVRLQRHIARLAETEKLMAADRAALAKLQTLVARGDDIEQGYRQFVQWRSVADSCADILRRRQPLEAQIRAAESQLERARGNVVRRIDRHLATAQQTRDALTQLDKREAELTTLRVAAQTDTEKIQRLSQARNDLRGNESEKATLEAECAGLKTAMNEIRQNMELLATGDAECPICRRSISEGEHEHVSALWTSEGTQLGDRFRTHRDRIKEIDAGVKNLTLEIKELEKASTTANERAAVIRRIESELGGREQLEKVAEEASTDAAHLSALLENNTYAPELVLTIKETSTALKELTYDAEQAIEADKQITALRRFEKEHLELQTARVRFSNLEQTISERVTVMDETQTEIEALNEELAGINTALEGEPELRARLGESRDQLERLQAERDELQGRFGAVQNQMEHLDRVAGDRDNAQIELGSLGLDADAYKELGVAFGRNGIQAMIVETILPELEDETNRLLARMANGHLHVSLRSTRQAVSNENIIETLDIIIRDESGERPYALYSGGESFRVDFAIRVALSKLLVRRAGTTIDMLIIDEGFGTQDSRGRDGLIEALQSIESDFETILVISHIDEVRDMFPTRIEVTKTDAGSQVTVI